MDECRKAFEEWENLSDLYNKDAHAFADSVCNSDEEPDKWNRAVAFFSALNIRTEAKVSRGEWLEAGLTPQQMWDEIQEIRKITGDDGTHGSPSNLVRSMAEALATVGREG